MNNKNKTMKRLEAEMQLQNVIDNLDLLFQQQAAMAKAVRNYYLTLQDAGFSEAEALELVKAHGLAPNTGG